MIEISDEKYWKPMNYYDGILYLSLLEIDGKTDWRMMHEHEENMIYPKDCTWWVDIDNIMYNAKFLARYKFMIIPVRDI